MANTTRLGSNQLHMLKTLVERGDWSPGGGWHWNNYSQTLRMMEALRRRGLAQNTGQEAGSRKEHYVPTDEAKSFIETLHTPKLPADHRQIVIVMMAEMDLEWSPTEGWHFKNIGYTELAMKALEREGLVTCVDRRKKRYVAGSKLLDLAYEYGYDPNLIDG